MSKLYLGIDVGSISTDFVLMRPDRTLYDKLYLRTHGNPTSSVIEGINTIFRTHNDIEIVGVGTTGSGRRIAANIVGADVVKNEITAHGVASTEAYPDVRTVLEIGGQDSKILFVDDGVVVDFNMNSVCAAGTGSFLDRQAERLGIGVEEIGTLAAKSRIPCTIAGRCAVFAESDMIHKQQEGNAQEDILAGLCHALVRNYLNNLCPGKTLQSPILFQGGVAANSGIVRAFEDALQTEIRVPEHFDVMGAWGAAILAQEKIELEKTRTAFKGRRSLHGQWIGRNTICDGCANHCRVTTVLINDQAIGYFGNRCENTPLSRVTSLQS